MTQAQPICEHCGAPLDGKTQFCGICGKGISAPVAAAAAAATAASGGGGAASLKKTVFGMPQGMVVLPGRSSVAPAPVASVPAKTSGQHHDAPEPEPAERERSTAAGVVMPPRGQMGRTMLGVPLVTPQDAPSSSQPEAPRSDSPRAGKPIGTKLGLGGLESPLPPAGGQNQTAVLSALSGNAGVPKHTLIGSSADALLAPLQGAMGGGNSLTGKTVPRGMPTTDHTLMGLEEAQDGGPAPPFAEDLPADRGADALALSTPSPSATSSADWPRDTRDSLFSTAPAPKRGSSWPAFALFGLLLVTAGVLGYLALGDKAPDVRVHVVSEAGRDSLEFEVPGAQPGTRIRFGGQEQALVAGRARFALAADAIRVGENVVLFDLVTLDGEVDPGRIGLQVDYRATLDTGPLRAGKAAIDVVVAARPGTKILLDGKPIMLDKDGRAVRSDPIDLGNGSGSIEHVVRYRVEPPGAEAVVGELRATLALTSLSIDRPGAELVTDRDTVEIAGEVEAGASVTIDGRKVEVRGNRFLDRFPLPKVGEYQPAIVAMAEGKAPRAIKIKVRRVSDLAKAAASFKVDPALSYAKIAQNPSIYRGQRVAMEGRVYNVSVDAGHSALQILVRQCPKGQRCPLWVSYPTATELTTDSWVRVLGTLQGEQQFRSETNELRSVPKVVAAFLLPIKP
jgi:hypothetical protein